MGIYGAENPNETGMFTFGYWLWPVASFIATYGLDHYERSVRAIEELTKRHTGEHAIRPYMSQPERTSTIMLGWAESTNVHVRRLASEGLRPRLPWSKRLTVFIDHPKPVFRVLDSLKDDRSRFVQKSVANNVNDYLKDNRPAATELLWAWVRDPTPERRWIIRHAYGTRGSGKLLTRSPSWIVSADPMARPPSASVGDSMPKALPCSGQHGRYRHGHPPASQAKHD